MRAIASNIGIVEQKRAVLRVVVGARSCERWLCNMLDKDTLTSGQVENHGSIRPLCR